MSIQLAYLHDIPGSKCGPEDGPWPRRYHVLKDADVWAELSALARPQSWRFEAGTPRTVDALNFQPCPRTRTQDRYVVQQLDIHGKRWTLTGVFDGHLGDLTVHHVAERLPKVICDSLRDSLGDQSSRIVPELIGDLLSRCITSLDNAILKSVLDIFPGGLDAYTDSQIRYMINDQHTGGHNYHKVRLSMYGTTALVALVDPEQEHLWVANVGDCQAFLVSLQSPDECKVDVLTTPHNGDNEAEVHRVRHEHPGELDCIINGRILGALAPTRCLGDVAFKQPPDFTRRILYNLLPGFRDTSLWEEFLVRNRSAPYISATPDITHRRLSGTPGGGRYLILNSDGLTDLIAEQGVQRVVSAWARGTVDGYAGVNSDNMALRLLRQALGGEDRMAVSAMLTLDMEVPWIDDTAIVVQQL